MVRTDDLTEAIRAGATTSEEIADHIGNSESATRRRLKKAVEDDGTDLSRESNPGGNGYIYGIEAADEADSAADMPVFGERDYDFAERVPAPGEDVYVETDAERTEAEALIDSREATGELPRFRYYGPPGTGKTTLARSMAASRQWPVITIQFTAGMRESELVGSPHIIGGESVWVDGPLTKALLVSQQRPVIVVLDEVNRTTFDRKSVLQSVLDHRCEVTIRLRGGEVISGDPLNFVTVATMNEGAEYETYPIDPAERRRHGDTWGVEYLGLVDMDREVQLVADDTPINQDVARVLVAAANEVRRDAAEDATSPIERGMATSQILRWAQSGAAYRQAGLDDPLQRAARTAVIEPHYDDRAAAEVRAILFDAVA